ncbi:MAG: phosphoribosylformimino-5-aminoimidazole carboxamide ribotide isomerase [Fibromonadaceae bacterium]|jgi:phosphoribosylformimino-5-aminoimidazole carboxamide ribotide isomerase|nr:phosphoribosylformimino-5-aminoimidazole carboxamide ribotide isomerase [Fibromonadaceae bacterium]
MTRFRPCIDLHNGKVKQIVGSSLSQSELKENFVSQKPAEWYAELYKKDNLKGGHVIMLGAGNEDAAIRALKAYPDGLQAGGGISNENAKKYIEAGASAVIVTSHIFPNGKFSLEKLKALSKKIGKEHLVIDLSCYKSSDNWQVAINRWQTITDFSITPQSLNEISAYCAEFLIHAAGVEGKQQGMDLELIKFLGEHSPIPTTYAGGASSLQDLETCNTLSKGRVDLTIGSALDIFGGKVKYEECVNWRLV